MNQFDPVIVEMVSKYSNTGRIELCTNTVTGVFQMAVFLKLPELPTLCVGFMLGSVNLTSCIPFWKLAEFYNVQPLRIYLRTFISNSLNDVMKTTDFLELEVEHVKRLLSDVRLKYSEAPQRYEMVYLAVMHWIRYKVIERRWYIGRLLRLIRPEEISAQFLNEVILDNKLMTENDAAKKWLWNNFNVRFNRRRN